VTRSSKGDRSSEDIRSSDRTRSSEGGSEEAELELQNQYSSLIQTLKAHNSYIPSELEELISLDSLSKDISLLIFT
jgi:hypothetical protein